MTTMTDAYTWHGRHLLAEDGEKIGDIKEIYEDSYTGQPDWALVSSGLFGTRSRLVPLAGATPEGENVRTHVTKDDVKAAPSVDHDGHLSEAEERRLFDHYNVPYSERGTTTAQGAPGSGIASGATAGHDTSGPETDEAMTRSEEELRVGKATQERGRARLRKYVVTEDVQQTVPVQREEVRLEREPITDENVDRALDGPEISEDEHEVVLHEEQPVVEKRTVPKERVALRTDTVTDEQEVSEELRKERIESEGDQL